MAKRISFAVIHVDERQRPSAFQDFVLTAGNLSGERRDRVATKENAQDAKRNFSLEVMQESGCLRQICNVWSRRKQTI